MDEALDLQAETTEDDWRDDLPELASPLELDTAEWDRQLREAERLLGGKPGFKRAPTAAHQEQAAGEAAYQRTDGPHSLAGPLRDRSRPRATQRAAARRDAAPTVSTATTLGKQFQALVAWASMCLGLAAFACGAFLLFWAVFRERPELWDLGLPITLGGQIGLLLGVCLQLERLWQENRQASQRLAEMDQQLADLERNTRLLGSPYQSASQTFYSHLGEGASPQLLLTDLKSQLDLLALRISQEQSRRR